MEPEVEQLDEKQFLVTLGEHDIPQFSPPVPPSSWSSFAEMYFFFEMEETLMLQHVRSVILGKSHVGAVLAQIPQTSSRKTDVIDRSKAAVRFGFRITFREQRHAAFFKVSCPNVKQRVASRKRQDRERWI